MPNATVDRDVRANEWTCFAVWSAETVCQLLLLMALLLLLFADDPIHGWRIQWEDVEFLFFATLVFMIASGYAISTAVVGVFFRNQIRGRYPATAVLLFAVHEQFFLNGFKLRGWERPDAADILLLAGGSSIAFGCTFAGNRLLWKWTTGGTRQ